MFTQASNSVFIVSAALKFVVCSFPVCVCILTHLFTLIMILGALNSLNAEKLTLE